MVTVQGKPPANHPSVVRSKTRFPTASFQCVRSAWTIACRLHSNLRDHPSTGQGCLRRGSCPDPPAYLPMLKLTDYEALERIAQIQFSFSYRSVHQPPFRLCALRISMFVGAVGAHRVRHGRISRSPADATLEGRRRDEGRCFHKSGCAGARADICPGGPGRHGTRQVLEHHNDEGHRSWPPGSCCMVAGAQDVRGCGRRRTSTASFPRSRQARRLAAAATLPQCGTKTAW